MALPDDRAGYGDSQPGSDPPCRTAATRAPGGQAGPLRAKALDINSVTDRYRERRGLAAGADWDVEIIRTAYALAGFACRGGLRLPGEPYLARPLATAMTLASMGMDADCVAAGLLKEPMDLGAVDARSLSEDLLARAAEIADGASDPPWPPPGGPGEGGSAPPLNDAGGLEAGPCACGPVPGLPPGGDGSGPRAGPGAVFDHGPDAGGLAPGAAPHSPALAPGFGEPPPGGDPRRSARLEKAVLRAVRDPRTLAVRLASRLHDMRSLALFPEAGRAAFAQETLDYSAPLAASLGLLELKSRLEDLSLMTLRPRDYADILARMSGGPADPEGYVSSACGLLRARLAEFGIDSEVRGRHKHVYGVWRKMILQNLPFDEIYDIFAFRVTVGSVEACYRALGVVHTVFKPLPGRFKDYVSLPAPDGYRSLHTAAVGPDGVRVEIRIGDPGMRGRRGDDAECLLDLEGRGADGPVRAFLDTLAAALAAGSRDPSAMLARLRKALDPDGPVLAFTPRDAPVKLPQGATPIDFAYRIHPGLGDRLRAAFVDGNPVGLGHRLGSLSTVLIVTDNSARPADDWLEMAASPKTRAMIRRSLAARPPAGPGGGTAHAGRGAR